MEKYKVVCCDIDGTLLTDEKSITQENITWIRKTVLEKNVKFVIVSGRPLFDVKKYYDILNISGLSSCCNGTCLYDEEDKLVADYRLDRNLVIKIISIAKRTGVQLLYLTGNNWYTETRSGYAYETKHKLYSKDCNVDSFDHLVEEVLPNKLIFADSDKFKLDLVKRELSLEKLTDNQISVYMSKDFIEIMPPGTDKSMVIKAITQLYGISSESIIAIGDDFNDIGMLSNAGMSVAMGNAVLPVKSICKMETLSNAQSGVAHALKVLLW